MNNKVIVFGATGNTGIEICKQLQEYKIPHYAFVRKGSENKIVSKSTGLIFGNVLDAEDVEKAIKSYEFTDVVIALGSRDLKKTQIRSNGTKNIVDTLVKLSAQAKVHAISALGAGNSWEQLNWFEKLICRFLLRNTMEDHNKQEVEITKSSIAFHMIRPVGLTNGELADEIYNQSQGIMPGKKISRIDLAKYLVDSMVDNKMGFSSICSSN